MTKIDDHAIIILYINITNNMQLKDPCPCCSGKTYGECCAPFHRGGALPESPLELMRSRYSAYALQLPDYIIETTHPENPHFSEDTLSWKRSIAQFSRVSQFHRLDILDDGVDTVTFTAHITQGARDATFTEKSLFKKEGDRWFYFIPKQL